MNCLYTISLPLGSVALNQRRHKAYLTLGSSDRGECLGETDKKTEAVSLKKLAERFTSNEAHSLGSQILLDCQSCNDIGRSHISFIKNLKGYLDDMEAHLAAHRQKIGFVFAKFLSSWLPCFFTSPEIILTEKLGYLQTMKAFLDTAYNSCPSDREVKIKRLRRDAACSQEAKENHLKRCEDLKETFVELHAMLKKYGDLKHETLSKANDGSWEALKNLITKLSLLSGVNLYENAELNERVEKLPNYTAFASLVPIGMKARIKNALAYLEQREAILEIYEQNISNINKEIAQVQAMTDEEFLAEKQSLEKF